jgi:GTP-binding protein HflX
LVSAVTGEGLADLAKLIETRLTACREVIELCLDPADGAGVSWLHRHTEVLNKSIDEQGVIAMTVRADPEKIARLRARFSIPVQRH